MNGRQICVSCGVGVRLPGGRHGSRWRCRRLLRSSPIAAIIRSSNLPERPTNGSPRCPRRGPGASPTNMMRACGLPSANTSRVAVCFSAQPSKFSSSARSASSDGAVRAASRAEAIAASGAGAIFAARNGRDRCRHFPDAAGRRNLAGDCGGNAVGFGTAGRPAHPSARNRPRPPDKRRAIAER